MEIDFKHPRHGKCLSVKSHTWISSNELCKKMEISRPCLYKLAKKKEWEFKVVAALMDISVDELKNSVLRDVTL